LDDKEAFMVLNERRYAGIFQFNGLALQTLTNQIQVNELNDIIAITALARPGPLNSGGARTWVLRKTGQEPIRYPHEVFAPYMLDTMGIVIYQEQILQIGREVGGLTWGEVTELRKAMSKSLGKEYFDKFGDRFKLGAAKFNIPPEIVAKVWDDLCAYGAWSFNKSHSVAYGIVSYWCCWLKAHYPVEFAAATLSHMKEVDEQITMLRELSKEGIDYLPVDAELSTDKWAVGYDKRKRKKVLIGPVSNVKGIGPKLTAEIISSRKRNEPISARAAKLLTKPKTSLDSLWPVRDRFNEIMPDPAEKNIFTPPTAVEDVQLRGEEYEVLLFVVMSKINPRDENEAINVAKRGGKLVTDHKTSLNLQMSDDTGTVFGKVNRFDYEKIGKEIVDRGGIGKAMYAIKGFVPKDFRMVKIKRVRFIGMMNTDEDPLVSMHEDEQQEDAQDAE
jgi:hypothetical protein